MSDPSSSTVAQKVAHSSKGPASSARPAPPGAQSQQQQPKQQPQQQQTKASPSTSPPTLSRLSRDARNLSSQSLPRIPGASSSASLKEFEAALQQQGSSSALKDLEAIWQEQHQPSGSPSNRMPRTSSSGTLRGASSKSLRDSDPARPRGGSPKSSRGGSPHGGGGAREQKPNLSRSSPVSSAEQQKSSLRSRARPRPNLRQTPSEGQLKEYFGGDRGIVLDTRPDDGDHVDEWGADSDSN